MHSGRKRGVPPLASLLVRPAVFFGALGLGLAGLVAAVTIHPSAAPAAEPPASPASSIMAAGHLFDVGRPVVLWKDPQGFDAYQVRCIDQRGGCCDGESK